MIGKYMNDCVVSHFYFSNITIMLNQRKTKQTDLLNTYILNKEFVDYLIAL